MFQQKTYQANHHGPSAFPRKGPYTPKWYYVDASNQVVGRLATVLARLLTGKHKPIYSRHADTGDFIVVCNAEKVVFTGKKWNQKLYRRHSGYIGGLKTTTAKEMLEKSPEEILRKAVWGMMKHHRLAARQLKKLKIYAGPTHLHAVQFPQALPDYLIRRTVLEKKLSTQ